jgi:hypothetical protein
MRDSTPGLHPGKTEGVESDVKGMKPYALLHLLIDEGYPTKASVQKVKGNRLALGVSLLDF